jgi:4-carboxymuconolactone decarboxylase
MRFAICALIAWTSSAPAQPQAAPARPVQLRGDRFRPLTYDEMTPEQKAMTDRALRGRGTVGIFNVLLRSPQMGDAFFQAGDHVRFRMSIPDKLKELAILMTARYWTTHYEWFAHRGAATQAGLSEAVVVAIAEGRRPPVLQPDEQAVYNFCAELFNTKQVSDATFQALKDRLGERGVVDLMATIGYYQMVSVMMNVDRYPLNAGQQPELKPLARPIP